MGSNQKQLGHAIEEARESAALARDVLRFVEGDLFLRDLSPAQADGVADAGARLRAAVGDIDRVGALLQTLRDAHEG